MFVILRANRIAVILIVLVFAAFAVPVYAAPDSKADEQAGALLYRDKGCPQCHGADLAGNKKGPSLADIRNDKAWPPEKVTKQITDGGAKMPPFADSLTDQEVAQLVAFLRAKDRPAPPSGPGGPPSN